MTARAWSARWARLGALLACCAMLGACGTERRERADARRAIDTRLLAALGIAQGLQHEADVLEARGDLTGARAKIDDVLAIDFPPVPEREDVRLDARGRLAELHLGAHDDAAAEREIVRALAESTRDGYFRARLHLVLGRIHELRAASARTAGDEERAREEGRRAIEAYDRGIAIDREVLGINGGEER